jgi:hypothetical protein
MRLASAAPVSSASPRQKFGDRHRCDIFKVAGQCGIRILKPALSTSAARGNRTYFCAGTLRRIGRRHGEAHLALVLRLIVESAGNATELFGDTITAVSNILLSRLVEAGSELYAAFDSIDLGELRAWSTVTKGEGTTAHTMTVALLWRLASPEKVLPKATAEEIARAERNAALKAVRQRKRRLVSAVAAEP